MITSASNSQMKQISKLQKSGKTRKQEQIYVVEGIRMFREIPKEQLVRAYATEQFYEEHKDLFQDIEVELVADNVMNSISDTKTPQGVLACVKMQNYDIHTILSEQGCYLFLEQIQDPGNLGTILRTAEGAGVKAVLMSKDTVDLYNSKVVRSTMGSIFRVPFVYIDTKEALEELKAKNIPTFAAHLEGKNFYQYDYSKSCCFFIGNEGNGLSDELTTKADYKIKIPMQGKVESLNAATATTVLVYEAMRQQLQ